MMSWLAVALLLATAAARAAGNICLGPCSCSAADARRVDCSRRHLLAGFYSARDWPPALQATAVDLSRNRLAQVGRFPRLPGVLSLSLRHNQIARIAACAFCGLESLEALDLGRNKLTGSQIRSDIFHALLNSSHSQGSALIALDLGYNNISTLQTNALKRLDSLQELRLNNNPLLSLEKSIQEALQDLNNLQVLDLSSTGLMFINDDFFNCPSIKGSLREFYLTSNHLTEVPKSLSALGSVLEILYLNDNPIYELNETSFIGLRALRKLSISEMGSLLRIAAGTFDCQEKLQVLYCSSNPRLNDIDKDSFRELKNKWPIKEVYLNNNSLGSLPCELLPWSEVDLLDIRDNPWECDCRLAWFARELAPVMRASMAMSALRPYCARPFRWSGVGLLDMPADAEAWCLEEAVGSSSGLSSGRPAANLVVLAVGLCLLTGAAVCVLCARCKYLASLVQPLSQPYYGLRQ
ncbi:leucine-rich repeat-containing G-protein coupled receptor 4-like isoform X2 [Bacillus rossius redtenbacheri]|uniref:leucine-rich repeat-containing G-protein coupled receptor 4-like isoform X2 n=1 Tax=Bacillus rossius redtenbacheri TaxID=93214 RepID=UPI002FDDA8EE